MTRAIFILMEILCFYQILRGFNGFKAKENFAYIFTNGQWIRWGSILSLIGYVAGISILWHYHADLASHLSLIGTLLIPIIMVTVWRTSVKKIMFGLSLFLLITAFPVVIAHHLFSLSAVVIGLINLCFISVLVEFKVVYKIYLFSVKKSILLYSFSLAAVLLFVAPFTEWYFDNGFLIVGIIFLIAFIIVMTIYAVKKYVEAQFIHDLRGQSVVAFKAKLEQQAIRMIETDKVNIYEFQSFWFPKQLSHILKHEFERLGITADVVKEAEQIKIHLFKVKLE